MIPGPDIVKLCSKCNERFLIRSTGSGNSFGGTLWTDGRGVYPMLPPAFWLMKCPECKSFTWINELKTVGECNRWVYPPENAGDQSNFEDEGFINLNYGLEIELEDYYWYLNNRRYGKKKEKHLRLNAWWGSNDKRRYKLIASGVDLEQPESLWVDFSGKLRGEDICKNFLKEPFSSQELDNIDKLIPLLDSGIDERLAKAEAMRELSRYAESEQILDELILYFEQALKFGKPFLVGLIDKDFIEFRIKVAKLIKELVVNRDNVVKEININN